MFKFVDELTADSILQNFDEQIVLENKLYNFFTWEKCKGENKNDGINQL